MTYLERTTRSSPAFDLDYCPKCEASFDIKFYQDLDIQTPWECYLCKEYLDFWWVIEDSCWYEPDGNTDLIETSIDEMFARTERINGYERMKTDVPYFQLTGNHCVCCDKMLCDYKTSATDFSLPHFTSLSGVKGKSIWSWLESQNIDEATIYTAEPNYLDCRACANYMTYSCVPLRNWLRFYDDVGSAPEDISPCENFEIDAAFCTDNYVNLVELQEAIHRQGIFVEK